MRSGAEGRRREVDPFRDENGEERWEGRKQEAETETVKSGVRDPKRERKEGEKGRGRRGEWRKEGRGSDGGANLGAIGFVGLVGLIGLAEPALTSEHPCPGESAADQCRGMARIL
jgi:hypothetical protein